MLETVVCAQVRLVGLHQLGKGVLGGVAGGGVLIHVDERAVVNTEKHVHYRFSSEQVCVDEYNADYCDYCDNECYRQNQSGVFHTFFGLLLVTHFLLLCLGIVGVLVKTIQTA